MKAFSPALSITVHVAIGAAVVFSTTKTGQTDPRSTPIDRIMYTTIARSEPDPGAGIPAPVDIRVTTPPDLNSVSVPVSALATGTLIPRFSPAYSPAGNAAAGQPVSGGEVIEERAEVLTSPLPVYPDLLRQAGVQGRVVLEAVVDTTGRVLASTILVMSATNPGFVAPARQALLATLFRPAMVGGKPIRMRVRIPYEFAIRNGTGRAR